MRSEDRFGNDVLFLAVIVVIVYLCAMMLFGCAGTTMEVGYGEGSSSYDVGGNNTHRGSSDSDRWWVAFQIPVSGPKPVVLMERPTRLVSNPFTENRPLFQPGVSPPSPSGEGGGIPEWLIWTLVGSGVVGGGGVYAKKKGLFSGEK